MLYKLNYYIQTKSHDADDSKSELSDVMTGSDSGRGSNEDNRHMAAVDPPSLSTYFHKYNSCSNIIRML